ncbi:hypothetical protein Btaycd_011450 [Bartonella taylorii]|nr:hypothetical protein Btaycd_011450 [Bartonella taylorii]
MPPCWVRGFLIALLKLETKGLLEAEKRCVIGSHKCEVNRKSMLMFFDDSSKQLACYSTHQIYALLFKSSNLDICLSPL